jgi:hypothetical protein
VKYCCEEFHETTVFTVVVVGEEDFYNLNYLFTQQLSHWTAISDSSCHMGRHICGSHSSCHFGRNIYSIGYIFSSRSGCHVGHDIFYM